MLVHLVPGSIQRSTPFLVTVFGGRSGGSMRFAQMKILPPSRRGGTYKYRPTSQSLTTSSSSSSSSNQKPWSFWEWYSQQLDSYPLLTKGVTSGLIAGTGDFICQVLSSQQSNNSMSMDDATTTSVPPNTNDTSPGDSDVVRSSSSSSSSSTASSSSLSIQRFHQRFFFGEDGDGSAGSWDILRTIRFAIIGTLWVAPVTHVWYRTLSTQLIPGTSTLKRVFQRVVLDQFGFAPFFTSSFVTWLWILEHQRSINDIPSQLLTILPDMMITGWSLWIPAMTMNFAIIPLRYQVLFSNVVALVWNVYVSYKASWSSSSKTS